MGSAASAKPLFATSPHRFTFRCCSASEIRASTRVAASLCIPGSTWEYRSMTRSDRVATLEEAKAEFQKTWDAWKAWAKLERHCDPA
jgi:hypothetical protein